MRACGRRRSTASTFAGYALASVLLAACSTDPFQVPPPTFDPPLPGVVMVQPPSKVTTTYAKPGLPLNLGRFDYDPRPRILSFCYSSQLNTPREVVAQAAELCPEGGPVTLIEEDVFFNGCSIFQPHRATFRCIPGPAPEPKYK